MNFRKFATIAVVAAAVAALVVGCGSNSKESQTTAEGKTVLRYQGLPSQVTWYELADHLGYFERVALEWKGDSASGPQEIQSLATNQLDIGASFNGAVAKLQQAGSKVTSVVSALGSDSDTFQGYYTLEGSTITTARDLIGKKVAINGLGAYPEYAAKEWLHRQGLSDSEIKQVEFVVIPPVNIEQALRQKQIDVGYLGSIIKDVALEHGGLHEVFRDTDIIGNLGFASYVLRDDFIASNPEDTRDFVQGTARAIRWAQTHSRDEVVAAFEAIVNGRGRTTENTNFVQHWKSTGVPAPGGVIGADEYSLWVDQSVRIGELPAGIDVTTLYTNEFNPYANGTYKPDADSDGNPLASK